MSFDADAYRKKHAGDSDDDIRKLRRGANPKKQAVLQDILDDRRKQETQRLSDRQEERQVDKLTLMGKADERARLRNWLALLALVVGASMLVVGIIGLLE